MSNKKRSKVLLDFFETINHFSSKHKRKQTIFIGISGFPGAGKSTLAMELENIISKNGYNTFTVHQDDFRIDKKLRLDKDGNFLYSDLPFINQWHDWKDLSYLLYKIKTAKKSITFTSMKYDSKTSKRTMIKEYCVEIVKDKTLFVIIEGAFIFDLGKRNLYNIDANQINNLLDFKIFVFRNSEDFFDKENFVEVLISRKLENKRNKSERNTIYEHAMKYVDVVNDSINHAIQKWKGADFFF